MTYERQAAPARIPEAEELGVSGLYDAYAEATALDAAAVKVGKEILAEVAAATRSADADGTSRRSAGGGGVLGSDRGPLRVAFESVEVEGFGAFADSARYPLGDRGVCAVVGDNRDDRCSDSNGAGKTTLVMAPMWALTGESDARVDQGGSKRLTKTDVVNDSRRTARVRVDGSVSGLPFWVERKVSRTKLVSLRYGIGDEEKTLADARLTQAALDRDLGAAVIARACFHGQHTVTALLDANDAALKAALGELVEAETWAEAKDLSRRVVSEKRKTVATLEADVETRAAYVRRVQARLDEATRARDEWEAAERSNAAKLEREKDAALSRVAEALAACRRDAEALRSASERWDEEERRVAAEAERRDREVWDRSGSGGVGVGPARTSRTRTPSSRRTKRRRRSANAGRSAGARRRATPRSPRRARARPTRTPPSARSRASAWASPGMRRRRRRRPLRRNPKEPRRSRGRVVPLGVCDRCRQPIDPTRHRDTLAGARRGRRAHARGARGGVLGAARGAPPRGGGVGGGAKARGGGGEREVRRRREEQALANAARAANERLAEMRARRVNAHVVYAALARAEALLTGAHAEMVPERRPERHSSQTEGEFSDAALLSLENGRALVDAAETSAALCERFVRELASRSSALVEAEAVRAVNPRDAEVATLASQAESESASLEAKLSALEAKREELATARRADAAFGTRGIQSYLFEGALSELSSRVGAYMEALTGGALTMELRPAGANESGSSVGPGDDSGSVGQHSGGTDETLVLRADASKTRSTASSTSLSAEKIERVIHAQSALGAPTRRSLRQLSGGERRRAAIALALAHADLALARGGVACDLLVLDEVLQHPDGEGAARAARCSKPPARHRAAHAAGGLGDGASLRRRRPRVESERERRGRRGGGGVVALVGGGGGEDGGGGGSDARGGVAEKGVFLRRHTTFSPETAPNTSRRVMRVVNSRRSSWRPVGFVLQARRRALRGVGGVVPSHFAPARRVHARRSSLRDRASAFRVEPTSHPRRVPRARVVSHVGGGEPHRSVARTRRGRRLREAQAHRVERGQPQLQRGEQIGARALRSTRPRRSTRIPPPLRRPRTSRADDEPPPRFVSAPGSHLTPAPPPLAPPLR